MDGWWARNFSDCLEKHCPPLNITGTCIFEVFVFEHYAHTVCTYQIKRGLSTFNVDLQSTVNCNKNKNLETLPVTSTMAKYCY